MTRGSLALQPPAPAVGLSLAERRRVLKGLSGEAKRVAAEMVAGFDGWNEPALQTLRAYALSCARLETLQHGGPSKELFSEIRANLALLKALDLETDR
jgi:hypothetical protein